jgi:hypothetical protein
MLRAKHIEDSLLGLVGWKQTDEANPDLLLSSNLLGSESGLYYQQAHPLLTLNNMASIAPDFSDYTKPEYDENSAYSKDQVIKATTTTEETTVVKYFKAIDNVPAGIKPEVSEGWPNYWIETSPFSEWLEDKTRSTIYKAIYTYLNDKQNKGTYKNLLEDRILFDVTTRISDKINNTDALVGFEIIPARAKGVTIKVNKIGLHFSTPGTYKVYIMHSSKQGPVYSLTFTKTQPNTCEWFKTDGLYLPYIGSEDGTVAGSWYVCYLQSELPANSQAINRSYDWSGMTCRTCNRRDYEAYLAWSKYMEINPFRVNSNDITMEEEKPLLWDVEDMQYFADKTWGLNLDITVGCDLTDFIVDQRWLFQDVLMKQMAVDALREFVYNPNVRTNRHSVNAGRTEILYEIDGDSSSMRESGLAYELKRALDAVSLATSGINRVCLPCCNHGLRYKPI